MKEILIRLLVAAFLTLAAFALSSSARGLQSGLLDAQHPRPVPSQVAESSVVPNGEYQSSGTH